VRLVDDDGEASPAVRVLADLLEEERERLDGADDDLLARLQELRELLRLRVPEPATAPTTALTCANCLMFAWICSSRMRRSVTTMIESKISLPSPASPR
jgi:DNA-binding MltR family transcriptional regulator